jgi:glycosyltransferase involved in cell wall biosynthesis
MISQGVKNLPILVFVGMIGWGVSEMLSEISSNRMLAKHIKILNDVSDAEVTCLYDGCKFTVYPSNYEGWGLPIAESLARGKFCLASDTSSLPEVGLEYVKYLPTYRLDLWIDAISELINDDDLLIDKEEAIKLSYINKTWTESYTQLDSIISSF